MGKKKQKSNPWGFAGIINFPNIDTEVRYYCPTEMAMGSPLGSPIDYIQYGSVEMHPKGVFGGPPVADVKNNEIAIPEWIGHKQKIRIFNLETGKSRISRKFYRVLHLKSFVAGNLTGIDSPIHKSEGLDINTNENGFYEYEG